MTNTIYFIDIDETTFHTYAKVGVYENDKLLHELNNQEYNSHKLQPTQKYCFKQFANAQLFNDTSKPILPIVNRVIKLIENIKRTNSQDKVIFLTARPDFDNKELFLETFRRFNIDVDTPNVYIERSGNHLELSTTADRKKHIILQYLTTYKYNNAIMYDDDIKNVQMFVELGNQINNGKYNIINNITNNEFKFSAFKVSSLGSLRNMTNILLHQKNYSYA